ncbi:hypothetical protein SDC9_202567 [bioreactor metagenome]|uniref:Uncharacterized protein n=1 Tax=bioreactor metagenome TaxID=1076179 RepID=A0A645IWS1_9ZZZZ
MGVFSDFLCGIAGIVHQDFLGGNEDPHSGFETIYVKRAILLLELHQVQ